MSYEITGADVEAARVFNRRLAFAPRFSIRNRLQPLVYQALLRGSQVGSDRRLRRTGIKVHEVQAGAGGGRVRLRVLEPPGPARAVVLDIHGGGWAIGNARMDDTLNGALVRACDVAVVSVDYRLATLKTPVQVLQQDCFVAASWLLQDRHEFSELPVFIVGESAGAHLAASMLLRLKAEAISLARIAGAVLYYGVYDLAGSPSVRTAGRDTLVLDGPGMLRAMRLLTPGLDDEQRRHPALSPLYGDLGGMPPALMFAGDLDPLLDDTLLMAERWREVAPVELHRVPASPHGFIRFPTRIAAKALARTHDWLRERLGAIDA